MININEVSYSKQIWGYPFLQKAKRQYFFDVYNGPAFRINHIFVNQYGGNFIVYEGCPLSEYN